MGVTVYCTICSNLVLYTTHHRVVGILMHGDKIPSVTVRSTNLRAPEVRSVVAHSANPSDRIQAGVGSAADTVSGKCRVNPCGPTIFVELSVYTTVVNQDRRVTRQHMVCVEVVDGEVVDGR